MPLNPSGILERLYSWVTDRDNGVKILAQRMDDEMNGIVQAFNQLTAGSVPFRGPVRTTNGTPGTPAFSFKDDPDTGMYRAGANIVGLTGGAGDLRVGATALTYNGKPVFHEGYTTAIPIANGGTGGKTGAEARANLSLAPAAITATSTNSASGGTHTHAFPSAQLGILNAEIVPGQVGSVSLMRVQNSITYVANDNTAGSNLRYCSAGGQQQNATVPVGTWKCFGYAVGGAGDPTQQVSMFKRIS